MPEATGYAITIPVMGFSDSIPISQDQFETIREAKRRLMLGLEVEEKLDLVLENYAELERCVLDLALESSIFPGKMTELLDGSIHLVNRRVANLLTTARLYVDQVAHSLKTVFGPDLAGAFDDAASEEYDSNFGYRAMEALRNHSQHRSLPTQSISFNNSLDNSTDPRRFRCCVVPAVLVTSLEEDRKFKRSILKEMKERSEKGRVSLMPLIREYVESFGRIHAKLRSMISADLTAADSLFESHVEAAEASFEGRSLGLVAVALDDQGLYLETEYVLDRMTRRRRELEKKNGDLASLAAKYVSSQ